MTTDEWKAKASKEAIDQYNKPISWFRDNVKCCHNCRYWYQAPELIYEYKFNLCLKQGDRMTPFDALCKDYETGANYITLTLEDNLLDYTYIDWIKELNNKKGD